MLQRFLVYLSAGRSHSDRTNMDLVVLSLYMITGELITGNLYSPLLTYRDNITKTNAPLTNKFFTGAYVAGQLFQMSGTRGLVQSRRRVFLGFQDQYQQVQESYDSATRRRRRKSGRRSTEPKPEMAATSETPRRHEQYCHEAKAPMNWRRWGNRGGNANEVEAMGINVEAPLKRR
jgi:hypothetical protein